jgi:hypothetical protein
MDPALEPYLLDQSGVVARRQAIAAGLAPHDLARLVRRRELAPLHTGVFLDHTGEPTFQQRAWGAVLLLEPAALAGPSALRAFEGPGSTRRDDLIHVVVAWERRVRPPEGVRAQRCRAFQERVQWNLGPPRLRYEEAALDVATAASSDFAALGELSRVIQSRRTTAARLAAAMSRRSRVARRDWLVGVLADIAAGTCSVLEHGYLHRVERAHGLAGARRQVRDRLGPGVVYRDVLYEHGVVAELDGRLFHDTTAQRTGTTTATSWLRLTAASPSASPTGRFSTVPAKPGSTSHASCATPAGEVTSAGAARRAARDRGAGGAPGGSGTPRSPRSRVRGRRGGGTGC